MKVKLPFISEIVKSTQGHDRERLYVVVDVLSPECVLVADGKYHFLASPKKKNVKHLYLFPQKAADLEERLINKRAVSDSEIKFAIKLFAESSDESPSN